MKSYKLTKIIAENQKISEPQNITIYNFLVRNAIKTKDEGKLWQFSRKITEHYFNEFVEKLPEQLKL